MIEVVRAGIYTTIQDLGRFGYRNQGVPTSGAMDQYSSQMANQIVGNEPNTAVIEFVLKGPHLYFHNASVVALSGANCIAELNGKRIKINQQIFVPAKSKLVIKSIKSGMYGYLAVNGGLQVDQVLGSYSLYPNITKQPKLNKGDCIGFTTKSLSDTNLNSSISYNENKISCNVLKVEKGAEFNQLNTMAINQLFNTQFTPATSSNRMAYTLEHNIKSLNAHEITSGNVQAGTVQLTPSGKVIVLMRDAQTTGGYARVLQLTPMAINQLSQKRPGEKVTFELLKKG